NLLVEPCVMLFAGDPLLVDGKRDLAITQQACADVMVVGIEPQHVDMVLAHRSAPVRWFERVRRTHHAPSAPEWSEDLERCRSRNDQFRPAAERELGASVPQ